MALPESTHTLSGKHTHTTSSLTCCTQTLFNGNWWGRNAWTQVYSTVEPRLSGHLGSRSRLDNRIDKPRLDPPTLLINSSASAHAQKISKHVSMVTAATRMSIWGTRLRNTPIFWWLKRKTANEVLDNGGPDNRGSTVRTDISIGTVCIHVGITDH